MAETYLNHGLGWRPDLPSNQDYGELNESIPGRLKNRTDVRSLKELTEKLRLNPESIKNSVSIMSLSFTILIIFSILFKFKTRI